MSRNIKFRAWHKKNGNMWKPFDLYDIALTKILVRDVHHTIVDELHIMQFTGLMDAYGNDVYDGDILEDVLGYKKFRILSVKGGFFMTSFDEKENTFFENLSDPSTTLFIERACRVVGNIYEEKIIM